MGKRFAPQACVRWRAVLGAALGAGVLCAALLLLPPLHAGAATFTVTNCSDTGVSGDGSLRGEIAAAGSGNTVNFNVNCPSGAVTQITLGSTLTLAANVTIDGTGHTIVVDGGCTAQCGTISPVGGVRVFTVNNTVTNATISSLTIQHGNAGVGSGGGINNNGTLTIVSCTISGNSAGTGGGIANTNSGTVMVTNSTVSGNAAAGPGGGIYNYISTATLTNSTVRANTTSGGIGKSDGGGIYSYGPLTVTGGTIGGPTPADGNQAGGSGGGVYLSSVSGVNTSFSLSGVTISHNTANDPQTSGGGGGMYLKFYNYPDTATITNSTITNNTATDGAGGDGGDGGGINNSGPNDGAGNAATTTITGSTISNNTCYDAGASSDGVGGGIANFGGKVNLTNSTIAGNMATGAARGDGGGIYNQDEMNVTGSTISGNTAASGSGGGVWTTNGAAPVGITVTNSTIVGNTATSVTVGVGGLGGGAFAKGRLVLNYTTVARNTASIGGGGLTSGSNIRPLGTIIALNTGGDCSVITTSVILSQGYNLDGDGSCSLTMPTDRPHDANPGLAAALAANGSAGPQTLALLAGSDAINHGGTSANGCPATDERGTGRPVGPTCDIGAFEAQITPTPNPLPIPQPAGSNLPGPPNPLPVPPQPKGPSLGVPNPLPPPRP